MSPKISKVSIYRQLYKNGLNRKIQISFTRPKKNDANILEVWSHNFTGTIILIRKHSLMLDVGDDCTINIGFRNINFSIYLDHCFKLKSKLYYEKGKY